LREHITPIAAIRAIPRPITTTSAVRSVAGTSAACRGTLPSHRLAYYFLFLTVSIAIRCTSKISTA